MSNTETAIKIPLIKTRMNKKGELKTYVYDKKKYNDKFYNGAGKEPIFCPCGGRYSKSSFYTHRVRSKTHMKYESSLTPPTTE